MDLEDVDPLAAYYYGRGCDVTDWATGVIMHKIDRHDRRRGLPMDEDAARATACRILGALLDCGWTAPSLEN